MDAPRFTSILDAYGAAPERWPAMDRSAALSYGRRSEETAAALERAANLDMLLDKGVRDVSVPDDLTKRILALAPVDMPVENKIENVVPLWRRVLPSNRTGWQRIAATALIGITAGILFSETWQDRADPTSFASVTVTSPAVLETPVLDADGLLAFDDGTAETAPSQSDLAFLSFTGFEAPTGTIQPVSLDDGAGSLANLDLL